LFIGVCDLFPLKQTRVHHVGYVDKYFRVKRRKISRMQTKPNVDYNCYRALKAMRGAGSPKGQF
jgi:hypothetical protein